MSLSLSLLSEVPEQIPPEQPDPPHFHGHLPGQFQRRHKWNQRLPIFCSPIYLMTRVLLYLSLGISIVTFNTSMISGVLFVVVMLLALFQPYKESLYNRLDICLVVTLMVGISSEWLFQIHTTWLERLVDRSLLFLISPIPLLYPLCLLSYRIWKSNILQSTITQIKVIIQRSAAHQQTQVCLPQQAPMTEATALLAQD